MSGRRPRPTAFEVSFPDEEIIPGATHLSTSEVVNSQVKRKHGEHINQPDKRRGVESDRGSRNAARNPVYYKPPENIEDTSEQEDTVLPGEPLDFDRTTKQMRIMFDFCILSQRDELLPLLEYGKDLQAIGYVAAQQDSSEDAGQEDDNDDEVEALETRRLRTTNIIGYEYDYTRVDAQIVIETEFARYKLGSPSPQYQRIHNTSMQTHRMVQLMIAISLQDPSAPAISSLDEFDKCVSKLIFRGKECTRDDYNDMFSLLSSVRSDIGNNDPETENMIRSSPLVQQFVQEYSTTPGTATPISRPFVARRPRRVKLVFNERTIDNDVLKPENQNQTHVTPLIARQATNFFRERLYIVGRPLQSFPTGNDEYHLELLRDCIIRASRPLQERTLRLSQFRSRGSVRWEQTVTVDGIPYSVGDVALIHNGRGIPAELPSEARIEHYFLFAKILYTDPDSLTAHVIFYQHSSMTALGLEPASDRRELFLTTHCSASEEPLVKSFCGKIDVMKLNGADTVPDKMDSLYFSRFLYHDGEPSFVDHPPPLSPEIKPPRNCPSCIWMQRRDREPYFVTRNNLQTLSCRDVDYHVNDCVLVRNINGADLEIGRSGVGLLGRITDLGNTRERPNKMTLSLFVRQVDYASQLPNDEILDERQVFSSDCTIEVPIELLVRKVHIWCSDTIDDLDHWLSLSPDHFYVRWHFRHVPIGWESRKTLSARRLPQCEACLLAKKEDMQDKQEFDRQTPALVVMDLFSGTGAMSLAMAEGYLGKLDVKYAVEISPSAAKSLREYAPSVTIFNQCANLVLAYMIKSNYGNLNPKKDVLTALDKHETPLPPPPKPGDIHCIVVGFPCQPHSGMNRFKKLDDVKSNLILNVLSYVDYYRPKYFLAENVPGFLSYELNAIHKIEDRQTQTGLRFVLATLVKMGYQVRWQLLNAAHFGTPQRRKRFFLMAAKSGEPMMLDPYPTHYFPDAGSLKVKTSGITGTVAYPVHPKPGEYLFYHTTVEDSISDLWAFDAVNPEIVARRLRLERPDDRGADPELQERRGNNVPRVDFYYHSPFLACPKNGYAHAPRNIYQKQAREIRSEDLQHYTYHQKPETTEMICNIPLRKDADYHQLPSGMYMWQLHDPASANARHGYKGSWFGRMDKDYVFQATVSNVGPTAKQCRCLHPWCHRIVTVRELARSQGFPDSFVFHSINDDVFTMHRQIGNAVPWQIGRALGWELYDARYKRWSAERSGQLVDL